MSNFKPIAMRCTPEQFEAFKPKWDNLTGITALGITKFNYDTYLTNNLAGKKGVISNIPKCNKRAYNREVYEEWNERIFLEACGKASESLQDRLANLEKEIKEVKALIEEENKPKIGDICKLWDGDKSIFIVGKLEYVVETDDYPYYVHSVPFKNCEKIADENFLKAFNNYE